MAKMKFYFFVISSVLALEEIWSVPVDFDVEENFSGDFGSGDVFRDLDYQADSTGNAGKNESPLELACGVSEIELVLNRDWFTRQGLSWEEIQVGAVDDEQMKITPDQCKVNSDWRISLTLANNHCGTKRVVERAGNTTKMIFSNSIFSGFRSKSAVTGEQVHIQFSCGYDLNHQVQVHCSPNDHLRHVAISGLD
ncbi:Oidioi.mRNA.OKI2018_I69.chr1.g411.t1.cds [Oikopleura dioica]|uniref:Oidioi.mRNA.OKI2018_I69.chr1.g411.t1.cds n=1 Tax=Oikopleura dioica TaxID=34765 RepID=A0ABN7SR12_OIKDI|nr:Oidioi.mRNA.OKI2018_I69.chr1.g411.t1.cds [Oikopleura dioica]